MKANTFPVYNDRPRRTEKKEGGLGPAQDNPEQRRQTSVLAVMTSTEISFKEAGERCFSENLTCPLTGRYNMYVNYVRFLDMMKHHSELVVTSSTKLLRGHIVWTRSRGP